ncbi:hypothetical protein J3F83DRAFT_745804 [Trichoderma novae-zelandiae]
MVAVVVVVVVVATKSQSRGLERRMYKLYTPPDLINLQLQYGVLITACALCHGVSLVLRGCHQVHGEAVRQKREFSSFSREQLAVGQGPAVQRSRTLRCPFSTSGDIQDEKALCYFPSTRANINQTCQLSSPRERERRRSQFNMLKFQPKDRVSQSSGGQPREMAARRQQKRAETSRSPSPQLGLSAFFFPPHQTSIHPFHSQRLEPGAPGTKALADILCFHTCGRRISKRNSLLLMGVWPLVFSLGSGF